MLKFQTFLIVFVREYEFIFDVCIYDLLAFNYLGKYSEILCLLEL